MTNTDKDAYSRVSVRRSPGILDFDCIAAMLCLVRSRGFDNCPDFLDAHIGGWEEWPMQDRHGLKSFQSSTLSVGPSRNNPGNIVYGRYLHYLRSFTVVDFDENRAHEGPDHAGLKCAREWVTIEGLYRDSILKLVERRYSVALNFLPLQRPCGHYALVSVADTSDNDIPRVWNVSLDFGRRNTGTNRETPWKTFGIQPAGLYTGVSVFQVQICAFIASWRDDWITTVDAVDGMVSVSVSFYRAVRARCRDDSTLIPEA